MVRPGNKPDRAIDDHVTAVQRPTCSVTTGLRIHLANRAKLRHAHNRAQARSVANCSSSLMSRLQVSWRYPVGTDVDSAKATRRLAVTLVLAPAYVWPEHLAVVVVTAPILQHAAELRLSGDRFAPGLP